MRIAIIGNGPSQVLYKPDGHDLVIGCNKPRFPVDLSAIADVRVFMTLRDDLIRAGWQWPHLFIIGARCRNGLGSVKGVAGGTMTLYERLVEAGLIAEVIDYAHLTGPGLSQSLFTSGHLAFRYACAHQAGLDHPEPVEIDMFGFDSVFGRPARDTTTREDLLPDVVLDDKETSVGVSNLWRRVWERLFAQCRYERVVFHGYEGDSETIFQGADNVGTQSHPKAEAGRSEDSGR